MQAQFGGLFFNILGPYGHPGRDALRCVSGNRIEKPEFYPENGCDFLRIRFVFKDGVIIIHGAYNLNVCFNCPIKSSARIAAIPIFLNMFFVFGGFFSISSTNDATSF